MSGADKFFIIVWCGIIIANCGNSTLASVAGMIIIIVATCGLIYA